LLRGLAVLQESHDAALLGTEIVHADARALRQLLPQQCGDRLDPRLDGVDADPHRVARRDRKADLAGDKALPGLEPSGIIAYDVAFTLVPNGGVEIAKRRL